ncbi:hypothetical protein WJX84_001533, partial [Apatococcus fuscideae]
MQSSLQRSGSFLRPQRLLVGRVNAALPTARAPRSRQQQSPIERSLTSSTLCHAATMEAPPKPPPTVLPREGPKYEYEGLDIGSDIDVQYGSDTQGIPKNRRSGVILHPTSLPGPYGTGEIGQEAYRFVDWLASAGMQIWQVLPLGPPETQFWSPYSGTDALCGHPLMIPLDELVSEGLMDSSELPAKSSSAQAADFNTVNEFREPLLVKVADRLLSDSKHANLRKQMDAFRSENAWV